jgi:hypothetical protein
VLVCAIVWIGGCAFAIAYNPRPAREVAQVTAAAAQLPTVNYHRVSGPR